MSDLEAENRRLRASLELTERAAELVRSLEPGQLYSRALDLLVDATSTTRGIALFRRADTAADGHGAVLRGFDDERASAVCSVLLDEKSIDLDQLERIESVHRGMFHDALRSVEVAVERLHVVPVRGLETEVGVLILFEDDGPLDAVAQDAVGIVARHTRTALENAETYSKAKERAFLDDVTEVYNARYLLSTCENEIQRAERYGNPLSILFLDLDRFKTVNDRFGHLVGSDTLRRLAKLLGGCVRQVDTLARYGGDEFTILLVDTGHDAALRIAERIRRTIEGHSFEAGRDGHLKLTISIGVATCPVHGSERDALLDAADKAMYRAKSEGRNRVCSAAQVV